MIATTRNSAISAAPVTITRNARSWSAPGKRPKAARRRRRFNGPLASCAIVPPYAAPRACLARLQQRLSVRRDVGRERPLDALHKRRWQRRVVELGRRLLAVVDRPPQQVYERLPLRGVGLILVEED